MENVTTSAIGMLSEDERKAKWIKTARWIYWINTGFFGSTLLVAGILYLVQAPFLVENNLHLGFPIVIYPILGTFKTLAAIAILWGRFPVLKEWAYVGYSLNLVAAAATHVFVGDSIGTVLIPVTLLVLVLISFRQWKMGWM